MSRPIAQASCIPYRRAGGRVQFCLITSIRQRTWGFPKGIIEPGDTAEETALQEAAEEAGLAGRLDPVPLGCYEYAKWGTTLTVTVFLMQVADVDDDWPEAAVRKRRWHTADEARRAIGRKELLPLLEAAVARLGQDADGSR